MKRIILTSGDVDNGLTHQRAHLFLRHLKHQYEFRSISFDKLCHSELLYADGLVMFHPNHSTQAHFIHRAKTQYGIKVLIDLDDMTDNLPSDHPEYAYFKNGSVPDIVKFADHVVVSTDRLQKHWGHLNKNISVIENQIDPSRVKNFVKQPKPYHSGFVVGWTGSQSHRPDLYNTGFIEGLRMLMRQRDDVRAYFHLLCPQTLLDEFGARVIYNESVVDFLDYPAMCFTYPFDVCAVPLYDHPFNEAKSDLRLLDMSPFKIPVVATNIGSYCQHSDRAILTNNTEEDWYEALKWCYETPKELEKTADKAFEYVTKERTILNSISKWDALFKLHLGH
jgi:hypothetical protein